MEHSLCVHLALSSNLLPIRSNLLDVTINKEALVINPNMGLLCLQVRCPPCKNPGKSEREDKQSDISINLPSGTTCAYKYIYILIF